MDSKTLKINLLGSGFGCGVDNSWAHLYQAASPKLEGKNRIKRTCNDRKDYTNLSNSFKIFQNLTNYGSGANFALRATLP